MSTMTNDRPTHHGQIMFGIVIMAAGVLILIDRLELANVYLTSRLWPMFPLGLGLLRLIDPPARCDGSAGTRRSGTWLVFIGCWGLMNEFHVLGFEYQNSWPVVLVFAGVNIVWRSIERPAPQAAGSHARREA
jgi:hypothetical protein